MARYLTEQDYLQLTHPGKAMALFNSRSPLRTSTRKARLFLCGCCRRVWDWLGPAANRAAVEAAERAADGLLPIKDLNPFYDATRDVPTPLPDAPHATANPAYAAAWPFTWPLCNPGCTGAARLAAHHRAGAGADPARHDAALQAEHAAQVQLVHDLLGNPYRPLPPVAPFLTRDVRALAEAAYEHRQLPSGQLDLVRLRVLSDALEDVGCPDDPFLAHLRSPGPHWRGCWAIDLLLRKK